MAKVNTKTCIKLNNIPHGFYEDQMKKYFSQFGRVKNVLLVRSEKTHKSRGFGFVEFEVPQVAKSAAEAMHNYLFFNHVLKCRQMDRNDLPKNLFKKKYNGPNSIDLAKQTHNTDERDIKKLRQHYRKIIRTQEILKKLGVDLECHIINKPGENMTTTKTSS